MAQAGLAEIAVGEAVCRRGSNLPLLVMTIDLEAQTARCRVAVGGAWINETVPLDELEPWLLEDAS